MRPAKALEEITKENAPIVDAFIPSRLFNKKFAVSLRANNAINAKLLN